MIQTILRHEPVAFDEALFARAFDAVAAKWAGADEETRSAIVDALFRLDGDRTVGFLDAITEDPDPWLRMRVIDQVAAIGDRRVASFVKRFTDDEDEMVREAAIAVLQSRVDVVQRVIQGNQ
jgi:HEAT repeat protein